MTVSNTRLNEATPPLSRDKFGSETPGRILDSAEDLFANQGIAATSLRTLTRAAGVNLAAVHYYFGSKEALLDAVVERRAADVNRERLEALERCTRESGGKPSVEEILCAFVVPGRRALEERGQTLSRLLARIHAQAPELVESLTRKHFGETMRAFVEALQAALPDIPPEEVAHRFRFSLGTLLHVFSANFDLDSIPGHPVQIRDELTLSRELIAYLAAGMRAQSVRAAAADAGELHLVAR